LELLRAGGWVAVQSGSEVPAARQQAVRHRIACSARAHPASLLLHRQPPACFQGARVRRNMPAPLKRCSQAGLECWPRSVAPALGCRCARTPTCAVGSHGRALQWHRVPCIRLAPGQLKVGPLAARRQQCTGPRGHSGGAWIGSGPSQPGSKGAAKSARQYPSAVATLSCWLHSCQL